MRILEKLFGGLFNGGLVQQNAALVRENARLEGLLDLAQAKYDNLQAQFERVEDERRELVDWAMAQSGAPVLYGRRPDPKVAPAARTQHEQRLGSSRSMRNWVQAAEAIEAEAAQYGR